MPKDWYGRLREWWDSWTQHPWYFKKRHCLLQGTANSGKTTAARFITNNRKAFIPSSNFNFCLQGLNDTYDYILWDDFQFNHTNRRNLLLLMQGDEISIDVKCGAAFTICWRKPIIFTTNFEIDDDAFLARIEIINTD
ncbi:MAG TPA: hypothetical protein VMR41_05990 [Patescibacteria group bacterium]|nr:hypothetical protein [Patescibacteria group bacterium]